MKPNTVAQSKDGQAIITENEQHINIVSKG